MAAGPAQSDSGSPRMTESSTTRRLAVPCAPSFRTWGRRWFVEIESQLAGSELVRRVGSAGSIARARSSSERPARPRPRQRGLDAREQTLSEFPYLGNLRLREDSEPGSDAEQRLELPGIRHRCLRPLALVDTGRGSTPGSVPEDAACWPESLPDSCPEPFRSARRAAASGDPCQPRIAAPTAPSPHILGNTVRRAG